MPNAMTSRLQKPLIQVKQNGVVANLHVQQEIIQDTINDMAYHELNIKQEVVDIKDEFHGTCEASGTVSEEQVDSNIRKYEAEDMSNFLEPYSCSICEYKPARKAYLVDHMKTHTGEKPYSCSVCEYKASQKSNLVRHMNQHSKAKLHSCSICEFKASSKGNLVNHMKAHTGKKPYSCSLCEYKTAEKGNLKKHMKVHTGEKPYTCSVCEYKAREKALLVKHMRRHTGGLLFNLKLNEVQVPAIVFNGLVVNYSV